jgi:hypothetical protein
MGQVAGGLIAVKIAPCCVARSTSPPGVSFFFDQPYWDSTGLEKPYVPPSGARSAQPMDEETLRRAFGWL